MRLLFAGTPEPAVAILESLTRSLHSVVGVLAQPDRAAGRGRAVTAGPVAAFARAQGLPLLQPERLREPGVQEWLVDLDVDCAVVVAYGQIIPSHLLALPGHGWLNLHYSLLPAWRGAAPVQHAILHGDEVTGACVFRIDEGLDTGPVFGCVTEEVTATDTTATLLARLTESGGQLMVAVLDALEQGAAVARAQSAEGVSLAPRITSAMTRLDWTLPASHLARAVRAFTPVPGAWTELGQQRVKLLGTPTAVLDAHSAPGEIVVGDSGVLVGSGAGSLMLDLVQSAGKAAMPASAWARGLRVPG
ncbi:MAG: methionyl-tRNA formyltransferase, partial [Actinobacteria bacterium]|nr:methionyl-tRNA formyltransferase [Actinomycetota bacterium]